MCTVKKKSIVEAAGSKPLFVAAMAIAMALLAAPSPLTAQTADCSGITDIGDRVKCKHSGFLEEQKKVIDNLEVHFGGVVGGDNFDRLKRSHDRSKKANLRTDGKNFKSFGKKKAGTCDLAEYAGDGDGICEPGEKCLEALGDGIGNDDSICKLTGKNKEVCVEICEGSDVMEDDTDTELLTDMEKNYDDITMNLRAANDLMESNGGQIVSMAGPLLASYEPADACKTSVDWFSYGRVLTMTIMKQVAVGVRGIADISDKGCNQDAAGFNTASVCMVLEGAATTMALVVETTDGIFSLVKWGIDSSSQQCISSLSADLQETKAKLVAIDATSSSSNTQLGSVATDIQYLKNKADSLTTAVNSLSGSVTAVQRQLNDLNGAMNAKFSEVNVLLSTPQGQRPAFPTK